MEVLVTLNPGLGEDLGPDFLVTTDLGGFSQVVSLNDLLSGITLDVPEVSTMVIIESLGICLNYVEFPIEYPSTTTTTTSYLPIVDLECVISSNATTYLTTPTYDTSGQVVHPDIYYNLDGWNGYKYWMGITPYPVGNALYENPSILVSNDGLIWSVPFGLTNPIEAAPVIGYYSDPDIFLGYDNKLWMVFRWTDFVDEEKLYVKSSTDGITWSAKTQIVSSTTVDYLSPSIIMEDGIYVMYFIDWESGSGQLRKMTCSTPDGTWSSNSLCTINNLDAGTYPWHVDVIKYYNEYHLLLVTATAAGGYDSKLFFASGTDGLTFTATDSPIINPSVSGWDEHYIYRACAILMNDGIYDYYDLWYSADNDSTIWHIGKTILDIYCYPTTTTTSTTTLPPPALIDNLISVWEFDETSGTTATDSHSTNDLTNTNATINQAGILDKAYDYNGTSSQLILNSASDFEGLLNISVSCWFKFDGGGVYKILVNKQHTSHTDPYYQFQLRTQGNTVISFSVGTNSTFGTSSGGITTGIWYHVVGTYDGTTGVVKIYVNSIKAPTDGLISGGGNTGNASTPLIIGDDNDLLASFSNFDGLIDQVAIWDRVLSQNDIDTLYNSGNGLAYSLW